MLINPDASVPFPEVARLARLSARPARQPQPVLRTAQAVHRDLTVWARDFPAVAHGRGGSIMRWMPLSAAVSYDGAPYATALEFARHSAAYAAYDDVMDEEATERNSLDALRSLTEEWLLFLRDPHLAVPALHTSDPFTRQAFTALADSARRISGGPGSFPYHAVWLELWEKLCDGMLREASWQRGAERKPSFDQYMNAGCHTVGFPAIHWVAAMAHAPPGISDADTSALVSLLIRAGYCVRIANDLSSEERDHSGHEVNAVPLMAEKYSCPSSLARRALRQLLRREMGRLFDEARTVSPAIANPYGWAIRAAVFASQWYLDRREAELTREDLAFLGGFPGED